MNPEIKVRPAVHADLPVIVQFNQAMAIESEGKTLPDAVITEGVRQVLSEPGRGLYFIAEKSGIVAGQTMVTWEWSDWRNGLFWWIQSVYVMPECRKLGVFRALHGYIRDAARRTPGVCGLRLYVYEENQRAMDAYRKLGMDRTHYALFEEEWPPAALPLR